MSDNLQNETAAAPGADTVTQPTTAEERFDQRNPTEAENKKVRYATADEYERMKLDQRLPIGLIMGLIAGLTCAALWAAISVFTGYQIGYMAIGVGAAVGLAVRYFGKMVQPSAGIAAAVIALLSCALGNFLSVMGYVANDLGMTIFEAISDLDYTVSEVMIGSFEFIDVLFYFLAVTAAYRFSFHKVEIRN